MLRLTWPLVLFVCPFVFLACAGTGEDELDPFDALVRDIAPRLFVDVAAPGNIDAGVRDGTVGDGSLSDSAPNPDAALPMGDPACIALSDCLQSCEDANCSLQCRMQAPEMASALYDAIYACASQNACNEPGGSYNAVCMEEHCHLELLSCTDRPRRGHRRRWGRGLVRSSMAVYESVPRVTLTVGTIAWSLPASRGLINWSLCRSAYAVRNVPMETSPACFAPAKLRWPPATDRSVCPAASPSVPIIATA